MSCACSAGLNTGWLRRLGLHRYRDHNLVHVANVDTFTYLTSLYHLKLCTNFWRTIMMKQKNSTPIYGSIIWRSHLLLSMSPRTGRLTIKEAGSFASKVNYATCLDRYILMKAIPRHTRNCIFVIGL